MHGAGTEFSAELSDASGMAESRWDFGNGLTTESSASDTTVEHTCTEPGHYSVNALAQDEGGFASYSFVHTVYTAQTANPPKSGRW